MTPSIDTRSSGAIVVDNYRYLLWRRWSTGTRFVTYIMANPSTADATVDDPTIRRCIGFAKRDGYDGLRVVNLFAWRATNPDDLVDARADGVDIVGEGNDHTLDSVLTLGALPDGLVVAAWGRGPRRRGRWFDERGRAVVARAVDLGCPLYRLYAPERGPTPHPLYLRADTPFVSLGGGTTPTPPSSRIDG